ncbi:hypothetical protein ERO13_D04G149650v2 [Gossypium hirsutum]|uniref:Uncharacterized protein n=3 Tax=Gossypium TaxID=3633 RepID=A0A5J5RWQ8_GOSBA|nr:hypothetical protein ES319_D04G172700v1 [Gossypium barbadense]KAG4152903.1 hypothetical protein ERO13_D04G149650v2 [Gossypium hirsutum]TYH77854.1 hypothetical protein ES332_D04G184700v1 [Gossypium tomentosum]TYI87991.1 hypothetical protein E1A91_D04G174800v1 [Gossypium mustelinum]
MEIATLVAISISGLLRSIRGTRGIIEVMKTHFIFLVRILGGSRKKIAKNIIPKVDTKRNVT